MDPGYCDEKCLEAVIDADSAAILESCQRESLGSKTGYIYTSPGACGNPMFYSFYDY